MEYNDFDQFIIIENMLGFGAPKKAVAQLFGMSNKELVNYCRRNDFDVNWLAVFAIIQYRQDNYKPLFPTTHDCIKEFIAECRKKNKAFWTEVEARNLLPEMAEQILISEQIMEYPVCAVFDLRWYGDSRSEFRQFWIDWYNDPIGISK